MTCFESFDIGKNFAMHVKDEGKKPLFFRINHSDTPNCKVHLFILEFESETGTTVLVPSVTTIKAIPKGTELTINYGQCISISMLGNR